MQDLLVRLHEDEVRLLQLRKTQNQQGTQQRATTTSFPPVATTSTTTGGGGGAASLPTQPPPQQQQYAYSSSPRKIKKQNNGGSHSSFNNPPLTSSSLPEGASASATVAKQRPLRKAAPAMPTSHVVQVAPFQAQPPPQIPRPPQQPNNNTESTTNGRGETPEWRRELQLASQRKRVLPTPPHRRDWVATQFVDENGDILVHHGGANNKKKDGGGRLLGAVVVPYSGGGGPIVAAGSAPRDVGAEDHFHFGMVLNGEELRKIHQTRLQQQQQQQRSNGQGEGEQEEDEDGTRSVGGASRSSSTCSSRRSQRSHRSMDRASSSRGSSVSAGRLDRLEGMLEEERKTREGMMQKMNALAVLLEEAQLEKKAKKQKTEKQK